MIKNMHYPHFSLLRKKMEQFYNERHSRLSENKSPQLMTSNYFNENQISAVSKIDVAKQKSKNDLKVHAEVADLTLIRSKSNVDLLQCFYPFRRQRVADLLETLLGAH